MKTGFLLFCLLFSGLLVNAQYSRHIIQFTDKAGSAFSLSNPSAYLSTKAIARRTRYQIKIDSSDLPVSSSYLDSLRKISSITVLSTSKWLNQVLIQTRDSNALKKISRFPFVKQTLAIATNVNRLNPITDKFSSERISTTLRTGMQQLNLDSADYGNSFGQIAIHEGSYLHNKGLLGQGITIVMLDAGYKNFTTVKGLDSLRNHNQILGTWDFVNNESSVAEDDPHGLYCLSILAGNIPGKYIGTAPNASYYLFRTEDAGSEFPVEEHYWAAGAERADSLGADMISSSLGYAEFDDPRFNYTYKDMNGNTTMVTRAADLAAKKGILICNSAGNSGGQSWKYIIAPADGDSVLAVGATNVNGIPAFFSSYGPSASGKIKPDVASVGDDCFVITEWGNIAKGDGTSFSNPNLAGLIACLWQAFPEFNNMEIIDAVKRSSSIYTRPNDRIGYGIPNMRIAYQYLMEKKYAKVLQSNWVKLFPNPFESEVTVVIKPLATGDVTYQLTDMLGRTYSTGTLAVVEGQYSTFKLSNLNYLSKGIYSLQVINGPNKAVLRLMK